MRKVFWSVALVLVFSACGGEETVELNPIDGEATSNLSSGSQSEEEIKAAKTKREEELRIAEEEGAASQTTMEILPSEHDFGTIKKEVPVSKTFTIKNTGDNPLVINDAKASCGCTVPKKPEEPIAPGETGELEVTFTSKPNQAGKSINKTVTVSANIPSANQKIKIKAQVEE